MWRIIQAQIILLILLLFMLAIAGCALHYTPAPREIIVDNLGIINALEERFARAIQKIEAMGRNRALTMELRKQLRNHFDVYVIYHQAAMVSLAHGQMQDYTGFVGRADKEIDAIELLLSRPA